MVSVVNLEQFPCQTQMLSSETWVHSLMVQWHFKPQGFFPTPQGRESVLGSLAIFSPLSSASHVGMGSPPLLCLCLPCLFVFCFYIIFLSLSVQKVSTSVSILLQGKMLCVQVQIWCIGRRRWIQAVYPATFPASSLKGIWSLWL